MALRPTSAEDIGICRRHRHDLTCRVSIAAQPSYIQQPVTLPAFCGPHRMANRMRLPVMSEPSQRYAKAFVELEYFTGKKEFTE
jgi:hypothetical protein